MQGRGSGNLLLYIGHPEIKVNKTGREKIATEEKK